MVKQDLPEENPGTRKLLNVFGATPPLCLGEPYLNSRKIDERSKGKQMNAGRMAGPIAAPGVFDQKPLFLFVEKEPYCENIRYKDVFEGKPEKKKNGFGSSDFPKRDEFSNTVRTEQLREVLRKETAMINELRAATKDDDEEEWAAARADQNKKKSYLFDVVTRQVPTSFKHHRDDRQGKFFYMNERKEAEAGKTAANRADRKHKNPQWVNVTVDGRLLTVLVDTHGNVVAQQAAAQDSNHSTNEVL